MVNQRPDVPSEFSRREPATHVALAFDFRVTVKTDGEAVLEITTSTICCRLNVMDLHSLTAPAQTDSAVPPGVGKQASDDIR
jgi:hypothetical protein